MRNLFLCFFALLYSITISGQQLHNANWCFGEQVRMNFNIVPPTATTSSFAIAMTGGTRAAGSVSDDNGNLLFYTNGKTVWGKNHVPMPNGNDLYGDVGFQNIVIVPKPGHSGIYYIFTGNAFYGQAAPASFRFGLYYSVVDMSLNGTNGDVIPGLKNIPLLNQSGVPIDYYYWSGIGPRMDVIRMTSTLHGAGDKIWATFLVKYLDNGNLKRHLYSYLVSENGINTTADGTSPLPTAATLLDNGNYPNIESFGDIKISPNGQYLCDAASSAVNLYDFNNQTGTVVFNRQIYTGIPGTSNPGYGVEFSPNSQFVYFTTWNNHIVQDGKIAGGGASRDTSYVNIYQNKIGFMKCIVVGSFPVKPEKPAERMTALVPFPAQSRFNIQLAIDNKIYACVEAYVPGVHNYGWLGVINQPDQAYPTCNYNPLQVQLAQGTNHWFGLPQWVHKVKEIWPKVYTGKAPEYLGRDNAGNLFMDLHEADITVPNLNHSGVLPSSPYTGEYTFKYSTIGHTNWTKTDKSPVFVLSSGDIQMTDYTYVNGATGTAATAPPLVPSGEAIIAETSSGAFITYANSTLYVHSASGTTSVSSGYIYKTVFNPSSNKLFVLKYWPAAVFDVYSLTGNSLNLTSTISFPGYPSSLVQISNQDRVYVTHNGQLQEFYYTFGAFLPVNVTGFTNSNILELNSNNSYTENRLLVYNSVEENIYAIDLGNSTSKKVHTSNFFTGNCFYVLNGDHVYMAGRGEQSTPITIGTQTIPSLPPYYSTIWLTKLSLQGDFNFRQAPAPAVNGTLSSLEVKLFPNPSSSTLKLVIEKSSGEKKARYSISIVDQSGTRVLRNDSYIPGTDINISRLRPGLYYVEINDGDQQVSSKIFRKI